MVLLVLCSISVATVVDAGASPRRTSPRNVLTIHSGAESVPANPILDAGIREALASRPDMPIEYFAEYLESDLFPAEQASRAFIDYIRRKYQGRTIDLVIAMTDTGLRFVLDHRAELFPNAPIVFFSERGPDDATRRAGGGAAGITIGRPYGETLKLALALHPSTQRVFVVANGQDARTLESVRAELSGYARRVNLTYLVEATTPRLVSAVRSIPPGSIVLYIWHSQQNPGKFVQADAVARLVADAAPVPVYGTSDLYIGTGVVGGVVRRTRETGNRIGTLALRILTGTRPQDIPIEAAQLAPVIDWRQVERWRIVAARLPAGSQIVFREQSAWGRNNFYIVGIVWALLAQSAMVAVLLIQMARRREAERTVRRGEAALRESYDRVRDLGARLLEAQEVERSRIAGELHDDIGQQLAVLLIDIQLLAGTVRARNGRIAVEAMKHAEDIAKSVHDISHRLHPARLRLLGLVDALDGLRRDMSRSDMTITFRHENIPPTLAPDLTVCFYRIVQEALQNALKYSKARNVSVRLRGAPEGIVLTIADDGVGFDPAAVWGRGLGLITAQERVAAVGGTFEIRARPGAGTKWAATVASPERQSHARSPVASF